MRIAFFSPLPPERSGIADYSYELLEELRHHLDVTVVVRDDLVALDRAPEGVGVVGLSSVEEEDFDCSVYQMGNNPKYHRYFFQRTFEHPGLLVLHDPSLADFHAEMCRKEESGVFRAEIAFDTPEIGLDDDLPLVESAPDQYDLDRLRVLLSRRIVESSLRTLVHSSAVAAELRRRYPGAEVATIQLPAQVLNFPLASGTRRPGEVLFGVFGGINYYKRIDSVIEAFRALHVEYPFARLVIAGRPDDREMTARLVALAEGPELDGCLEVKTELSLPALEAEMHGCDVAVSLRWPTAGEMSATLMRTFGAGRPAVVTDVLQFRELDQRFCWRVPVEPELEAPALLQVMRAAAADPVACAEAGQIARRFVECEATYRIVSEQYVGHVEDCHRLRRAKVAALAPLSLRGNAVLGVNLLSFRSSEALPGREPERLVRVFRQAGVDVVDERVDAPRTGSPRRRSGRSERLRPGQGPEPSGGWTSSTAPRDRPSLATRSDRELARALGRRGRARTRTYQVGHLHDVALMHAGARDAAAVGDLARVRHLRGRRIVAYLEADVMPLPATYAQLFHHADEVWVPSAFSADLVRSHTSAPVVVQPLVVPTLEPPSGERRPGPLRVLALADGAAGLGRSNPWAAIAAYRSAFTASERGRAVELCLAALGVGEGEGIERLLAELALAGGELTRLASWSDCAELIEQCDVFVSLHRTTAFGAWCVEAMAAGKPVVATGYGGNAEYMTPSNSCLVGYDMARISEGDFYLDGPDVADFDFGQTWAVPDLVQAAAWLRRLFERPELRGRIGSAAARSWADPLPEPWSLARLRSLLAGVDHRSPRDAAVERRLHEAERRLDWLSPPSLEQTLIGAEEAR